LPIHRPLRAETAAVARLARSRVDYITAFHGAFSLDRRARRVDDGDFGCLD
jgi:hypothetical protein